MHTADLADCFPFFRTRDAAALPEDLVVVDARAFPDLIVFSVFSVGPEAEAEVRFLDRATCSSFCSSSLCAVA